MAHPIEILEHRIAPAAVIAATSNNQLLSFDSDAPGTIETITITGFAGTTGETLVGIDFRPATGGLYGFTVNDASQGQLYQINPLTGEATAVGGVLTSMSLTLSKTAGYGIDFNPSVDRLRIVNSDGENFRVNPNNGALAGVDTDLTAGAVVHGSAYDRSFAGTSLTTLFGIDVTTDQLVLQGSVDGTPTSPNSGAITNVGALGVNATAASFDIANGTGLGFAALQVGGTSGLYTINLSTGAATLVGSIGNGTAALVGLAVETEQIEIVNPKTGMFTDVDGDIVTIKITKGELTPALFELGAGPNGGAYLRLLNLSDPAFAGTNLTISAKPGPDGGDKLVSVGYINATGNDLGTIKIAGDLTQIDAGDVAGGLGVKSLTVDSFGRINALNPAPDALSTIEGSLTKLSVKRDFSNVQLNVNDSTVDGFGRIGSIVIGGSLNGGTGTPGGIISAEELGTVRVGGDVKGGTAPGSGTIFGNNSIASVTIGGSLIGGPGDSTGRISSEGQIGKIAIKGSIIGGDGLSSGTIFAATGINSITVGESLIGGNNEDAGSIASEGTIGSITIKDSITGGTGAASARVSASEITKLTVGKSITAGSASSGVVFGNNLGTIKVGGDILGSGDFSGVISAENSIGSVTIGGAVNGSGIASGRISATTIGSVTIKDSLSGSNEDAGAIVGFTSLNKVVIGGDLTGNGGGSGLINSNEGGLGSISIKGSIRGGGVFGNTGIDSVTVGGDVSGDSSSESAIASSGPIGTVTIKGSLNRSNGNGNIFAQSIDSVTVNGDLVGALISAEGAIGSVKVQGSMQDSTLGASTDIKKINVGGDITGSFVESGAVFANGRVDSITVKGSIDAGSTGANIITGTLGSLKVGGDVVGSSALRVIVSARGTEATSGTVDLAIASITVGGRVENTDILAGYSAFTPFNADAQIGKVTVGKDWITSNLVAGISSEDAVFGNDDDGIIGEVTQVNSIVASIASLTIKGSVVGTFGGADGFAFTAEEIKSATISGKKVSLEAGTGNDNPDGSDALFIFGGTQDVRLREIDLVV